MQGGERLRRQIEGGAEGGGGVRIRRRRREGSSRVSATRLILKSDLEAKYASFQGVKAKVASCQGRKMSCYFNRSSTIGALDAQSGALNARIDDLSAAGGRILVGGTRPESHNRR